MRKAIAATSLLAASALLLVSCAMPYDDPNYGKIGEAGASAGAGADETQQSVADLEANPTSIGVQEPLTAKPVAGKEIITLSTGSAQDKLESEALKAAAKALGWNVRIIEAGTTADTQSRALTEAIGAKPDGIHVTGELSSDVLAGLAAADAADVPIVCTGCAGAPDGPLKSIVAGEAQMTEWGRMLAAYILGSTPDGQAGIEVATSPSPALAPFTAGLIAEVDRACADCFVESLPIDEGVDPGQAVADALLINVLSNWVALDSGENAKAVVAGIDAGGVSGQAQIAGNMGTAQNIQAIKDGTEAAWTAFSVPIAGWRVVDAFARILGGQEPVDALLPSQIMSAANVAGLVLDAKGNYVGVADYETQFTQLWQVG